MIASFFTSARVRQHVVFLSFYQLHIYLQSRYFPKPTNKTKKARQRCDGTGEGRWWRGRGKGPQWGEGEGADGFERKADDKTGWVTKGERPHHAQQGCTGRLPTLLFNALRSQTLFYSLESGNRTYQACLTVTRNFQQIYIFFNDFLSFFSPPSSSRPASLFAGGARLWILLHFGSKIFCQPPPREENETDWKMWGSEGRATSR